MNATLMLFISYHFILIIAEGVFGYLIFLQLYDHQYHMGLLILERKEWESKNEQIKASAESAELMYRRDKAAHASALAEAKKREENLKKALGVEKECVAHVCLLNSPFFVFHHRLSSQFNFFLFFTD